MDFLAPESALDGEPNMNASSIYFPMPPNPSCSLEFHPLSDEAIRYKPKEWSMGRSEEGIMKRSVWKEFQNLVPFWSSFLEVHREEMMEDLEERRTETFEGSEKLSKAKKILIALWDVS